MNSAASCWIFGLRFSSPRHVATLCQINVSTVDTHKNQLTFKANMLEMDGKILVDFRLSKGCGLEFKKRFLKIKRYLEDVIDKPTT
ncbi:unnamed protein product [Callosobruchus maculatus]|uniref:Uncharacterized protein n=1 Tax=Callosobruchus maculatus TaxID=64391 RepID=A0A653C0Y5_CALMS|nr:unnamed protein product [Callosobruchus maculatus]